MIADFLVPFLMIGLAELGDKTQLCILFFSSKTKKHLSLLIGTMLAFLVVDGIAIAAGSWATSIVPEVYLKFVSGVLFVAFGILMFFEKGICNTEKMKSKNPFVAGFAMILLTEWGDKTQIASGLLATRYNPALVLAGTMAALLVLSAMAVYLGRFLTKRVQPKTVSKIAGAAFVVMGASFFFM